ncbi:cupin domain-containing protein [Roseibium limicola]|uniref:Cupin domain-containing protein n=1 Tax=Roseibium limicola TaxID=2816037 RepID=A0A939JB49_9HYPH|nr:cupin domain-containing protein [Roseibium limicola]MBO0347078.1 cupin domain-containing protein [Roseibium limicola]
MPETTIALHSSLTADEVVQLLQMSPHPEGGFYAETFRDEMTDAKGRAASTLIYFLLPAGIVSRWHRVDAVETWHFYAGSPLELSLSRDGKELTVIRLGADLLQGERPQGIVPRNAWQQARSLGPWTLVGCTVAPGFQFEGFEMAPPGWQPG